MLGLLFRGRGRCSVIRLESSHASEARMLLPAKERHNAMPGGRLGSAVDALFPLAGQEARRAANWSVHGGSRLRASFLAVAAVRRYRVCDGFPDGPVAPSRYGSYP